jgi:hypothetical protein
MLFYLNIINGYFDIFLLSTHKVGNIDIIF